MLEIRDLSWTPPGAERPLWQALSFAIAPGDSVVVTGPSGAGKSTLLRCLIYLEKPDGGTILWRREPVTAQTIRPFRHRVVYLHQSPVALAPTISQNLAIPRQISRDFPDHRPGALTLDEQRQLLAQFQLADLDLGRRFDELSPGEQQRLCLVRALSVQPAVLLLDEPTASLDDTNAGRVEEYLDHYLHDGPDRALIWVTHNAAQRQRVARRTLAIDDFHT